MFVGKKKCFNSDREFFVDLHRAPTNQKCRITNCRCFPRVACRMSHVACRVSCESRVTRVFCSLTYFHGKKYSRSNLFEKWASITFPSCEKIRPGSEVGDKLVEFLTG